MLYDQTLSYYNFTKTHFIPMPKPHSHLQVDDELVKVFLHRSRPAVSPAISENIGQ